MMKRLLFLLITLFLSLGVFAQGPFTGFFKPSSTLKSTTTLRAEGDTDWGFHFRPAAELNAFRFDYDKDAGQFVSSSFAGFGIGVSVQHYVEKADGTLVNNYGLNALVMFDTSQNQGIGLAATINALQFVNVGAGYDLTNKNFFLLTGAVWTF